MEPARTDWDRITDAMFLLAYLARFVPAGADPRGQRLDTPVSHEEAAAVSGAGWLRTLGRIVVPQIWLGVATAWVITFVLAFGELGVSILIAPPRGDPADSYLYDDRECAILACGEPRPTADRCDLYASGNPGRCHLPGRPLTLQV